MTVQGESQEKRLAIPRDGSPNRRPGGRRSTRLRPSMGSRIFDTVNILVLVGLAIITVLPFLYVIAGSFARESELASRPFFLWPNQVDLSAYEYVFSTDAFLRSLVITVLVTAVGALVKLALTVLMAYPLAHALLPGRNLVLTLVVFTMVFGGGMIPTYLVVRALGLLDTYSALVLPSAISAFYLIVVKNFFQELPHELQEAAKIDGCTEFGTFWRIVLPLSKPVLATFGLFYSVAIWNDFTSPLLYLSDPRMWTLQMFIRQVTVSTDLATTLGQYDTTVVPPEQGVIFATVVVGTIPILLVYPFLQKHFAKGMFIGSIKG